MYENVNDGYEREEKGKVENYKPKAPLRRRKRPAEQNVAKEVAGKRKRNEEKEENMLKISEQK